MIGHPEIRPAFGERNLPVVMAIDGNYIPYLRVVLRSILASTTSRNLDVIVLYVGIDRQRLDAVAEGFLGNPRMSIRFVDVSEAVAASGLTDFKESSYYTVSIAFKLLAPELLSNFDKAIILDIDLVVHRDLGELFDTDLGGAVFGGVRDIGVLKPIKRHVELAKAHGYDNFDNYINAGVMVVDFKAYRDAGLARRLISSAISVSKSGGWLAEQDAINFNCGAKIRHIDPRWNVQVGDYCIKRQMEATGGEAYITHFTGPRKPWSSPWLRMAHLWWRHVGEDGTRLWRAAFGVADDERTLGEGIAASVVVAVYNAAPYISETLVSLRAQTLRNIEIICVDDGSTDGTSGILADFAARDPRIKVVSQKNSGGAVARNRGLDEARGRWLLVADADDFSRPDMLADMVAKGEADDADIVAAGYYSIEQQFELAGNPPRKYCEYRDFGVDKPVAVNWRTPGVDVFSEFCLAAWNKLYRADFINRAGIRFHLTPPSDDTFFVVVAFGIAERIVPIAKSYYHYRSFLPSSQLGNSDRHPMSGLNAVRDVVDYFAGHDRSLRLLILGTSARICIDLLCRMRTSAGFEKAFYALRDGGLKSLIYSDIDASEIDAKSYDRLYRMLLNGANMTDFLLERCRIMHVWAVGLSARCSVLTAERNLLRKKLGLRASHPADESVAKKIRGLIKEFVPYAIERDYCRRRYGLVNRWDSRKTKGTLKKAARFCFELLPYGFVYRFSKKRYSAPLPAEG